MKPITCVFLLLFLITCLSKKTTAQNQHTIDSLSELLLKYKPACKQPCIGDSSKVNLLNELAAEIRNKYPDSAFKIANDAFMLSNQINWQIGLGNAYLQIGSCYYKTGDFDSSLNNFFKSLDVWNQIEKKGSTNQEERIAGFRSLVFANIGTTYISQANYPLALDYSLKALKLSETFGNEKVIALSFSNIGIIHRNQKNYAKAIDYYFKALKIRAELKDTSAIAATLSTISIVYSYKEDYSNALSYAQKALRLFEEIGDKSGVARLLGNIGAFYQDQGQYDKSIDYFLRSLKLKKELGVKYEIAMTLGNIGAYYYQKKNYDDAINYFTQALNISDSIGDLDGVMQTYQDLSTVFTEKGNYKKALENYKKAIAARDSIFDQEKTAELTRKEMNYEFEKKQDSTKAAQDKKDAIAQQEIAKQKIIRNSIIGGSSALALIGLLAFINLRSKRKKERAELSLQVAETEMKALRSQMNPHFLFNALSSIQSFLLNNQPADANTYLLKFKELVRLVLENSMHQEVALEDDMKALELYMQLESIRLDHPFTYQFYIDDTIDMEQTVIPPLILQPFVENAIWHGLQPRLNEGGIINISINKREDNLHCVVEDNGVGRKIKEKKEHSQAFKKESLGIKLTEERLKIINELKKVKAYFNITDLFSPERKPCGTRVELILPLSV